MESSRTIVVTHFINPHLFWYYEVGVYKKEYDLVINLEQKLQLLGSNKMLFDQRAHFEVNDKVAVYFLAWNKFIRGEVLFKPQDEKEDFIVWSMDHGFPFCTKATNVRRIPEEMKQRIDHIRQGGVGGVVPAELVFDYIENRMLKKKQDSWAQRICDVLEKKLLDAAFINFIEDFETVDNHHWGNLIIADDEGKQINVQKYMTSKLYALEVHMDFEGICSEFESIKISKWQSNNGRPKMKMNSTEDQILYRAFPAPNHVDESARRKVEDWCARNAQLPEATSNAENVDYLNGSIDDITFDDSASAMSQQGEPLANQENISDNGKLIERKICIGQMGNRKMKNQNSASQEYNWPTPDHFKLMPIDSSICVNRSDSTSSTDNVSVRMEKFARLRAKYAQKENTNPMQQINSPDSSSSSSMRICKLMEFRQKFISNAQENYESRSSRELDKELRDTIPTNPSFNDTSSTTSSNNSCRKLYLKELQRKFALSKLESKEKSLEDNQYEDLETTACISEEKSANQGLNSTSSDKLYKSIKSHSARHPFRLNYKLAKLLAIKTDDDGDKSQVKSVNNSTSKENAASTEVFQKEKSLEVENINKDTHLEDSYNPMIRAEQPKLDVFKEIFKQLPTTSSMNDSPGYDGIKIVPAGFDLTRLNKYRDEKNHWHRKKITRYDKVPHDATISSKEGLMPQQQGAISSDKADACSMPPQLSSEIRKPKITSTYETEVLSKTPIVSACGNSRRRKLKSPTLQIKKMDRILKEAEKEKKNGNKHILDIKTLSAKAGPDNNCSESNCNGPNTSFKDQPTLENCGHASKVEALKLVSHNTTETDVNDVFPTKVTELKRKECLPVVKGENKLECSFVKDLILAHSSVPLYPLESIIEAAFLPEIHQEMSQMYINKIYRVQVYAWPHALRGNSLFVVNARKSGKTWSYLPALCSLVCYRVANTMPTYGPIALVLVASSRHAEYLTELCRRLMYGLKRDAPVVVASFGLRNFIETKIQLLNSCGILVTTPSSFLRLMAENEREPLFEANRLRHVVIDDLDLIQSRAPDDFNKCLKIIAKMCNKSKSAKTLLPQLVVTSRDWDGEMVNLIRHSNQPLLLIGDFLEAAVYGKATISIQLRSRLQKGEVILKFIKKQKASQTVQSQSRTLIMCNDDEDVALVEDILKGAGHPTIACYSGAYDKDSELYTINEWNNKVSDQILVCADARLIELQIQNVQNLIHFTISTSWTQFTTRFSALMRTYENMVKKNFDRSAVAAREEVRPYSIVLLDEDNNVQLPRLVDFMLKHNQTVHPSILAVAKRQRRSLEDLHISKSTLLCPQLLEFGECDEPRCGSRHELARFDMITPTDDIPTSGEMRVLILKVFSPTHYVARLLEHKPLNSTKWIQVRRSADAAQFAISLNHHYRDASALTLHWPPSVGDICIYMYSGSYRRALIINAPPLGEKLNVTVSSLKITIKLIDDGVVIPGVKCGDIFECNEKFKDFPALGIDLRLMNVVPHDNERLWESKTTKQVEKWIMNDMKPNQVVHVSINFALADTVWINNLAIMEKLESVGIYRQVMNLKKSLIEKQFAVLYEGERKSVRDIADEYGLFNLVPQEGSDCKKNNTTSSDLEYQSCNNSPSAKEVSSIALDDASMTTVKDISMKTCNDTSGIGRNVVVNGDEAIDKTPNKSEDIVNGEDFEMMKKSTESWCEIPLNELVKVEIGDESENGNWENIFLQIIDNERTEKFDQLNELIEKHIEKQKTIFGGTSVSNDFAKSFKPLHNCIIKYNDLYLRAKLYGIFGNEPNEYLYRFFLCDYACFINVRAAALNNDFYYETNDEIINFTPYQAIHCTLAGLQWDHFVKRYQVTKDFLYACAVQESNIATNSCLSLSQLPIKSYKILLYECDTDNDFASVQMFNKTLLENDITVVDPDTKHLLQFSLYVDDDAKDEQDDYNGDEDKVVTVQELIEHIQKCDYMNFLDYQRNDSVQITEKATCSEKDINNKNEQMANNTKNYNKTELYTNMTTTTTTTTTMLLPPPLKTLHKRPSTVWYETEWLIYLSINVPDVSEYFLKVTTHSVQFFATIREEKYALVLNLLGCIVPELVSHEISGLNVIVRLVKGIFMKWPRLLNEETKYNWLKYNYNAVDIKEITEIMPHQHLHSTLCNSSEYINKDNDNDSDSNSEKYAFQTYNYLNNEDDTYDPFS